MKVAIHFHPENFHVEEGKLTARIEKDGEGLLFLEVEFDSGEGAAIARYTIRAHLHGAITLSPRY